MRFQPTVVMVTIAFSVLSGCGKETDGAIVVSQVANRQESYCDLDGLAAPARQSIFLIDQTSVVSSVTATPCSTAP